MRALADHNEVADLRLVLDDAENPGFAADATIAPDASMRPVDLGYVADPRLTLMGKALLGFYIPPKIAPPDIGEVPERPDSVDCPLPRSQAVAF